MCSEYQRHTGLHRIVTIRSGNASTLGQALPGSAWETAVVEDVSSEDNDR
jgi:hypothetical protein